MSQLPRRSHRPTASQVTTAAGPSTGSPSTTWRTSSLGLPGSMALGGWCGRTREPDGRMQRRPQLATVVCFVLGQPHTSTLCYSTAGRRRILTGSEVFPAVACLCVSRRQRLPEALRGLLPGMHSAVWAPGLLSVCSPAFGGLSSFGTATGRPPLGTPCGKPCLHRRGLATGRCCPCAADPRGRRRRPGLPLRHSRSLPGRGSIRSVASGAPRPPRIRKQPGTGR